ncbi:hypothetical protein D3C85_1222510 [compost metagenome]
MLGAVDQQMVEGPGVQAHAGDEEVAVVAVGDPALLAPDDETFQVPPRRRAAIGTALRRAHAKAGEAATGQQQRQVALAQAGAGLGQLGQQRRRPEVGQHALGDVHGHRAKLLEEHRLGDRRQAHAAVLLCQAGAGQAELGDALGDLAQGFPGDGPVAEHADDGRHLGGEEGAEAFHRKALRLAGHLHVHGSVPCERRHPPMRGGRRDGS